MIKMRKINPSQDCAELFKLAPEHNSYNLFPHQPQFINAEEFQNWITDRLFNYFHDLYVVEELFDNGKSEISGFLLAYDYRIYDSHCQICGYLRQGINSTILKKFIDSLFKEYPLNKVFMEVIDIDHFLITAAREIGFIQEATLYGVKFVLGEYRDLYIMGLYPQKR